MNTIYEPKGRAREYSPLALNLYSGCSHSCQYCYAPNATFKERESFNRNVSPRKNIINELRKFCEKNTKPLRQVLLNFTHDPYDIYDEARGLTREALQILLEYKIPVSILSKGGVRILRDLDLFKKFGNSITVGATMVFSNDEDRKIYEPNAATVAERYNVLKTLHSHGIRTWVSLEPVIIPNQTLRIIYDTESYISFYRVGKVNGFKTPDTISWPEFINDSVPILRELKKDFYIKKSLRDYKSIELLHGEMDQDRFLAKHW